ncbi:unnamed protein product [Oppiella nova]|uniref:Uncharacterized protein n=1 Tax=Oppiella nova TaxID=334625 RepID=A0A7R9LBB8_9ACAR|nr:unnamed protein product [Oppiella nova]CAG2161773.1 unnamed protein product [Oppiella nova]
MYVISCNNDKYCDCPCGWTKDATRVLKADKPDSFIWSNGERMTYTNWDSRLGGVEPNGAGLEYE